MNKHINQLIQIQEMEIILRENEILHKNKDTEETANEILANIAEMKKALPDEILDILDRISSRYEIFVSPMINDTCMGCFMKLPVAEAIAVKNPHQWSVCPSCNRFLYADDKPLSRPDDSVAHYKGVAKFSSLDLMTRDLKSETHAGVLEEMARLAGEEEFVEDGAEFAKALLHREALCSTAVGLGIAFPHARGVKACGLTLAVGMSKSGVDFGDGETVNLLFVSAVPTQASMFYMDMVSKLARYFGKQENIDKLLECETADEMWKIMVKIGR
ncbi:MAG: PTS transporter subunit EIIA [Kiritimatiellaeota bacterium]|nr:PTS transporter subunit EIIA [Kiritimatiellota bacterium]